MPAFLVLSDIHANLQALHAVFAHASKQSVRPDAIWCLGDLVGYGPQPGECVDLLRKGPPEFKGVPFLCVRGNHDQGVVDVSQNRELNGAKQVLDSWKWTAGVLTADQKKYLAELPISICPDGLPRSVRLVHAAPSKSDAESMNHYMLVAKHVEDMLDACTEQICFFGHTHLPCYFECDTARREARPRIFPLEGKPGPFVANQTRRFMPAPTRTPVESKAEKLFINPGSVGQPRWGHVVKVEAIPKDERTSAYPAAYLGLREASYLWVELEATTVRLWLHYVSYDVDETLGHLDKIKAFEVPDRWRSRLSDGLR